MVVRNEESMCGQGCYALREQRNKGTRECVSHNGVMHVPRCEGHIVISTVTTRVCVVKVVMH